MYWSINRSDPSFWLSLLWVGFTPFSSWALSLWFLTNALRQWKSASPKKRVQALNPSKKMLILTPISLWKTWVRRDQGKRNRASWWKNGDYSKNLHKKQLFKTLYKLKIKYYPYIFIHRNQVEYNIIRSIFFIIPSFSTVHVCMRSELAVKEATFWFDAMVWSNTRFV